MAQASFDRDVRGLPVNVGLLVGFAVSLVAVVVTAAGFQSWLDSRIDMRISNHANVKIYPRLVELERNITQIKEDQKQLMLMIESQSEDRNIQYRQISEQQGQILEALKQ